jgi:hypothetical protein
MKAFKNLRPYQRVIARLPKGYEHCYPFKEGDHLLFLNEIVGMPGHCAVVDRAGKVHWGFGTEYFEVLDDA